MNSSTIKKAAYKGIQMIEMNILTFNNFKFEI